MIEHNFAAPFENYHGYSEYPEATPQTPEPSGYRIHRKPNKMVKCGCGGVNEKKAPLGFLTNMALDDIIIIGLILILLMEEIEERDWATIIALGFLLF